MAVRPRRHPRLLLVAVCLGGVMVGLDGTAITIAAPWIARSTHASLGDLALIANVYLVLLAVCILPAGRLADRFGRRVTFIAGALGFGACSLGLSLSTGVGELIVLRAGQGLFAALLQPTALALLTTSFPRERLGAVLGVWGAVNALAIGLGPVVAGFVVQGLGWPAVFLINVPVAILAVTLVRIAVPESRTGPTPRPLRQVLARPQARAGAVLVALSSFAVFELLFLLTLYLQNVHGLAPSAAGAWLLAPTIAVVIGAIAGGVLAERFGPRWPVAVSMVAVAAGLIGLGRVSAGSGYLSLAAPAFLAGLGIGVWVIAATSTLVGESPEGLAGTASSIQQASSQVGGVLGVAAAGIVVSARVDDGLRALLREHGLGRGVADAVLRARDVIAEGRAGIPRGASASVADAVRASSHLAFTTGMRTAFLGSAAFVALTTPLALRLGRSRAKATAPPTGKADLRPHSTMAGHGGREVEVLADVARGERLREITLHSRALGRPGSLFLIVPEAFSATSSRRWPVLVLLHGADDGPSSWLDKASLLDRCRNLDALVVAPEGGPIGFYTDWARADASGRSPQWEQFHLGEILPVLHHRYRASERRVIAGVSMGGYGAIVYAAKRPGMFAAAASYSGLLDITRRGMPTFVAAMLLREREHRHALWGSPRSDRDRWIANDPYHLASALRGTALYLSCSDGAPLASDHAPPGSGLLERWVGRSTDGLVRRLQALEIPVTVSRGPGAHDWPTWRRELDRSWPFLEAALGVATAVDEGDERRRAVHSA